MLKTKLSILASSIVLSSAVFAHDNSCNINLDGDIEYRQGVLNVELDNNDTMTITPDRTLLVNGEEVTLTSEQQEWVNDYYSNIQRAIPMSLNIAANGIELAQEAVNEVFGELLGPGNQVVSEFDDMFREMTHELNTRFYDANGDVYVNTREMEDNEWITQEWEDRIEEKLEYAITNSMGSILVAIGTQMMTSGGDMEEFGNRMEAFGETIEQRIETQAMELESEANELCEVLQVADQAENKMQQNIAQLRSLNLMDVDYEHM